MSPKNIAIKYRGAKVDFFLENNFRRMPLTSEVNKKPIRYPPVIPSRVPSPPRKPEKTGRPIIPRSKYKHTEIKALFVPKRPIIVKSAKVCIVKGTEKGIVIKAQIIIMVVDSAI